MGGFGGGHGCWSGRMEQNTFAQETAVRGARGGQGPQGGPLNSVVKNRFEVLAGSVEGADQGFCTTMDLEPASPLPYPVSWDADSLLDRLGKTQASPGEEDSMDLGAGAP
ncbi:hypothetical protein AAFF_G00407210 [Aldrovandia affinis]|uniref:Uncharacterized protein n=1 Tax=Aldrovandia affinis TaxID=143900 RepID=A0AAD7VY05_9TELE|nr:hypothetical protein AAFF_G00407210 [Aldrovandia affinis]